MAGASVLSGLGTRDLVDDGAWIAAELSVRQNRTQHEPPHHNRTRGSLIGTCNAVGSICSIRKCIQKTAIPPHYFSATGA